MSSLGWIASFASSILILATLVEAIIDIRNADYSFAPWQYTLIMIAYLLITVGFNTWGARLLPMIETTSLFGHLAGFLVTIIPLWFMAPKNSARTVLLDVVNNGGWSNTGTSCLIAQVSVLYCNIGESLMCRPVGLCWSSWLTDENMKDRIVRYISVSVLFPQMI